MKKTSKRWFVVCVVACAITLVGSGCKSAPQEKEKRDPVKEERVEETSSEPMEADEPPPYCEPGREEYNRKLYRWCVAEGGVIDGAFTAVYPSGKVRLAGQFELGQLAGTWTSYYEDTEKQWEMTFAGGKETGVVKGWYPGGALHYEIGYAEGARDGESIYYFEGGEKAASLIFSAGEASGTWRYWHPNGQMSHEYKPGAKGKEGVHAHWDASGKKKKPVVGQLPKSKIYPVLDPLGEQVVGCYQDARVFDKSSGKMVAQVTIGYGGEVSNVTVFESDFEHPFMTACTKRHIESLTFPDNPYGPKTLIRSWQLAVE